MSKLLFGILLNTPSKGNLFNDIKIFTIIVYLEVSVDLKLSRTVSEKIVSQSILFGTANDAYYGDSVGYKKNRMNNTGN